MNGKKHELITRIIGLDWRIRRCMEDSSPKAWLELNLSIAQLKSLIYINHEGETNFKKVAEALEVTPPNVTGIIDRLVEQGLVNRTENPVNRRMLMLSLTNTGKSLIQDLKDRKISHLSSVLATLTDDQLSKVAEGFNILADAVETTNPKAGKRPQPLSNREINP